MIMCTTFETDGVYVYHCLQRVIIHLPCFFSSTWTLCILHHCKWKCFENTVFCVYLKLIMS